jgi:SAM-dependent methyltransferase
MGSWESHLPDSLSSCTIEAVGLNEQELKSNGSLNRYLVQDLNMEPELPYEDQSFDAVVCTVSMEYLIKPREVMAGLARILRPGGVCATTVSERWFPGKQIDPWAELHPFERQGLVLNYFLNQPDFENFHTESIRGYPRPSDDKYGRSLALSDALYMIWANRAV